jgi:DNA-binding response OmpR family regulator
MLHKRQAFTCPCCGGFVGEAVPIDDVLSVLTGHKQSLVKALSSARGMKASRNSLMRILWNAFNEPDTSTSTFHVVVSKSRKLIEPYGWTIVSVGRGGDESIYRLIPLEADA